MSYQVVVPCVLATDKDGQIHHKYEGAVIHWLSDDQAKHFLDEGLVKEFGGADDEGPPAKTAPKAEWVDYAVSKGADPTEAEESTKQELQDLYGG